MRIATWNVNSVRTRLGRVLTWLERFEPDVLCLQETKVVDGDFPVAELEAAGYRAAIHGQKSYNGVALLSRHPITDVVRGFDDGEEEPEARLLAGTVSGVRVISAYVPNGSKVTSDKYAMKQRWLTRLRAYLDRREAPDDPVALCGDFNIAADDRDAANPDKWRGSVLFNPEMHAALANILDWGLADSLRLHHEEGGLYSWWDYRALSFPKNDGLRIDYVFVSRPLGDACRAASLDRDQRKKTTCPEGSAPSDHVPAIGDFDLA